jgi:hypothetical protein
VSFLHRFGASLNCHIHYHCCVIDGVFEPAVGDGDEVRFRPAAAVTPDTVAAIAEKVRIRVLRWFARSGLVEADDVREVLPWQNSGFSLDAPRCASPVPTGPDWNGCYATAHARGSPSALPGIAASQWAPTRGGFWPISDGQRGGRGGGFASLPAAQALIVSGSNGSVPAVSGHTAERPQRSPKQTYT